MQREELENLTFTALRILAGTLMCLHGVNHLLGWWAPAATFPSQLFFGGILELTGGALIAMGLYTRLAAFILSGQMAVAYFQFHWKLHLANLQWLPMVNQGEDTVLYCFSFLFFWARGAGPHSLDRLRGHA